MNLKKQLNVAFIVRKYSTSGGTERYIYTISKYLAEKGHNITIFCSKAKLSPPNKNIKIKKIFTFPGRITKTLMFYYLTQLIDLKSFDIVQGSGKILKQDVYRAGGGFHKLYLKYQNKRKKLTLYDKIIIKIEKNIYNTTNTKFVVAVSKFIAKEIQQEFNFPKDRIAVIYNSIDVEKFYPLNIGLNKSNNLKLLFVANDFKLKGLQFLLDAIKNLKDVELTIVGNDSLKNFKISKNVKIKFVGEKHGKELIKLYQTSDLLVHPTYYDPFSNVCLEALACGTPVITTKINGVSEIIDNYKDGVVIDSPENIRQLINSLRFFQNKNKLHSAKKLARKKAEMFSIDKHIDSLMDLYKEVIKLKQG